MINKFKIPDPDLIRSEKEIDYEIRNELAKVAVERMKTKHTETIERFPALQDLLLNMENRINSSEVIINYPEYRRVYTDILEEQRLWLISKNRDELLLDEGIIRKHLRLLDLQEEKLQMS